ncbi:hypothetical protein [Phyllobacterium sp. SB3]|uniref:hypothetical protein n=1 Tax=Phyllobacterium sp. SB3 TaxID=3156073 RepID=UPI0032AEDE0C
MSNGDKSNGNPVDRSSSTTFGRSVESEAQIADAASRSSSLAGRGETLHIYRLVPIALPDDPRWENSPFQGEVVVAARTTGDARIVAAGRELDFMEVDAAPADDVTTFNASAFRDDKLYTVIEIESDRTDLTRGVIVGDISIDNIRPVQSID